MIYDLDCIFPEYKVDDLAVYISSTSDSSATQCGTISSQSTKTICSPSVTGKFVHLHTQDVFGPICEIYINSEGKEVKS